MPEGAEARSLKVAPPERAGKTYARLRPSRPMPPPFGPLRFLYMGSADMARDVAYYETRLGAEKVWDAEAFGARVAAFHVGEGPLVLLASHRAPGTCIQIYEVKDLAATARKLEKRGWKREGEPFEVPNGPCILFHDLSGNPIAFLEDRRPGAMERE